jgi:hypothetical protein
LEAISGEIRVNQGGEPGHDDYGLPPVDIQIPDDARELERDVQAYYRELRALRRHERSNRWRAPLRRSGMIVPLIAGCLVLALVAGMVLTMFSANPNFSGLAGQRPTGPGTRQTSQATRSKAPTAAPSATNAAPGLGNPAAVRLPAGKISVAGKGVKQLRGLVATALAIVPANCACAAMIAQLLSQARLASVPVYLIGKPGVSVAELNSLASASANGAAFVALDAHNVLKLISQKSGPTIVLVDAHGGAKVEPPLSQVLHLEGALRQLRLAH